MRPGGVHSHLVSIVSGSDNTTPGMGVRRNFLMMIAVTVVAASCAGSPPEVPVGADGTADPVLVAGRDVFGGSCKRCHGASGGGGSGPRLHGNDFDLEFPNIGALVEVISSGRNQMPSFSSSLTEEQLDAVARYIREIL